MFYVLVKEEDGVWAKTSYGAPVNDWNAKSFRGMALKINADHAIQEARTDHPTEAYRLVYSEEEL